MKTEVYTINKNFIDFLNMFSVKSDLDFKIFDNFIYFYFIKNYKEEIVFQFNYNIDTYFCNQFRSKYYPKIEDDFYEDFLLDIYNLIKK